MKTKKDTYLLVGSVIVIIVCAIAGYLLLTPKPKSTNKSVTTISQSDDNFRFVRADVDQKILDELQKLNDYGTPELTEIGKPDLFGNY